MAKTPWYLKLNRIEKIKNGKNLIFRINKLWYIYQKIIWNIYKKMSGQE